MHGGTIYFGRWEGACRERGIWKLCIHVSILTDGFIGRCCDDVFEYISSVAWQAQDFRKVCSWFCLMLDHETSGDIFYMKVGLFEVESNALNIFTRRLLLETFSEAMNTTEMLRHVCIVDDIKYAMHT